MGGITLDESQKNHRVHHIQKRFKIAFKPWVELIVTLCQFDPAAAAAGAVPGLEAQAVMSAPLEVVACKQRAPAMRSRMEGRMRPITYV